MTLEAWNFAAAALAAVLAAATLAYMVLKDRQDAVPRLALSVQPGEGPDLQCVVQVLGLTSAEWDLVDIAAVAPKGLRLKAWETHTWVRAFRPTPPIALARLGGVVGFAATVPAGTWSRMRVSVDCVLANDRGQKRKVQAEGFCP